MMLKVYPLCALTKVFKKYGSLAYHTWSSDHEEALQKSVSDYYC